MKESIIVYGPQGCGKSMNADKLRRAFGLDTVIDDWRAGSKVRIPKAGALVLTSETNVMQIAGGNIAAIDYESAIAYAHRRRRQRLN